MNLVGHIAVAASLDTDEGVAVGSVLPDIAAIGRFRLAGPRGPAPSPSVAAGVAIHYRTDESFHGHPWFVERNRALRAELSEAGVDRGPARASSHVGIEMLLDGHLLSTDRSVATATAAVGRSLVERHDELVLLVAPAERDRWAAHLARFARWWPPGDYHDPAAVAERLYRVLGGRRRIALPRGQTRAVGRALARHQQMITTDVPALVEDLTVAVQAGRREP